MIFRVATIDEQISLLEQRRDLVDHSIHRSARLDHHQDPARTLQFIDEVLEIRCALNVFAGATSL